MRMTFNKGEYYIHRELHIIIQLLTSTWINLKSIESIYHTRRFHDWLEINLIREQHYYPKSFAADLLNPTFGIQLGSLVTSYEKISKLKLELLK